MRTLKIFILIFLAFNIAGFSQAVKFGFTGGAGISNVEKTNNIGVAFEQRTAVADYYAGLTAEIKINNDFSFKPELFFERKGWTSKYNNLTIALTPNEPYFAIGDTILNADRVKMNYVKLPLNISFTLPQVIEGKISVETGPYVAYAVSGTFSSYYGNNGTNVYNFSTSMHDMNPKSGIIFKHFDYGLNFKIGYELSFGLVIQVKYELGLYNVVTNQLTAAPAQTKFKSILFGISYAFF